MPLKISFKKYGAWKKFQMMLKPEHLSTLLKENVRRSNKYLAMYIVRRVRQEIKAAGFEKNADLTMLLKGSSKPLVGAGDAELFKAITHQLVDDFNAFVGVLRNEKGDGGEDMVNVAQMVHDGGTIAVTDAMRGLFYALASASRGEMPPEKLTGRAAELYEQLKGRGEIFPLKESTTAITIPGRPFLEKVFEDDEVVKKVEETWTKALNAAFEGHKVSFSGGHGGHEGGGGNH